MKRTFSLLFFLILLLNLSIPVLATETTEATTSRPENACGESLTWSYASGKLTITGSGEMDDFSDGAPWDGYASSIYILELTGGVTTIGAGAFQGFANLTDIDFGASLREIGENAFRDCTSISTISLPKSFRLFGPGCFQGCTSLTEVHCAGGMPSFRMNCLWNGGHITIFCPDDNVWSEKYVGELETNFHDRLEVLTESGKDVYVWPEETEATQVPETTEAPTETPTEAPTVPTTIPTEAPTTAPTMPETEASTAPTQAEETAAAATEPEEAQDTPLSGAIVAVFLLSGTLSLLLIGMLIFKGSQRGGRYRR